MQFRVAVIYFLLIFSSTPLIAKTDSCSFEFKGLVVDDEHLIGLPGASVFIKELNRGVATDISGKFIFKNICSGNYTIICRYLGYTISEINLHIEQNLDKRFVLVHLSNTLNKVEISAERAEKIQTETVSKLNDRQKEQNIGLSLGEGLSKIAGVNSIKNGPGIFKPIINGLHSNRILIQNNEVRQEGQQWGSEHGPEIDPFVVDEFLVVKGANSVRYGSDAMGGVIILNPKKLPDTIGINAQLNTAAFTNGRMGVLSGLVEGKFKKAESLSFRVQGTLKRAGNFKTPDYFLKNSGFAEKNYSATVQYQKNQLKAEIFYSRFNSKIGIFTGSHIGNITDLLAAIASDKLKPEFQTGFSYRIDRPYQTIVHDLAKISIAKNDGKRGLFKAVYGLQNDLRKEFDKDKPLNDSLAALNNPDLLFKIITHSIDLIWEQTNSLKWKNSFGLSGMTQKNVWNGRFFIPNFRNYSGGIFAISQRNFKNITLEAGLRYDYKWLIAYRRFQTGGDVVSTITQYDSFSGSIGANYKPTNQLTFKINVATAWKAPTANELYSNGLHHGSATVEIGDETLTKENSISSFFTTEYMSKKLNITVSAFSNHISNFIYLAPKVPATLTIKGAFPTYLYKQANVVLNGIDFSGKYMINPAISFRNSTSLIWAYNKTIDDHLTQIAPSRIENGFDYAFETQKLQKAYLGFSVNTVFEQKRFPTAASEQDYLNPPKGYSLLNFNAGSSINFRKQIIRVGISAENILNTKYRDYLNRFRYFADETGRSFSIKLTIPLSIK